LTVEGKFSLKGVVSIIDRVYLHSVQLWICWEKWRIVFPYFDVEWGVV